MPVITDEQLVEALSPVPCDFENLIVNWLYEELVQGKYRVGFEVYVVTLTDKGILDKTFTEVFYDRGYVTFPIGEKYSDDYISQEEKVYSVDDASLDEEVRDLWIQYITERLDAETAEYYLESEEKHPSSILTTVCENLLSREKEA